MGNYYLDGRVTIYEIVATPYQASWQLFLRQAGNSIGTNAVTLMVYVVMHEDDILSTHAFSFGSSYECQRRQELEGSARQRDSPAVSME